MTRGAAALLTAAGRAALLLTSALLAGCAAVGNNADTASYWLDAEIGPAGAVAGRRAADAVLRVAPVRAEAAFDTVQIAYSLTPSALAYYRDSRWVDTPARMLEPVLTRALERSGLFRAVLSGPSAARADYTLTVTLVELRQVFTVSPSRTRLTLRAELVDSRSARLLAARRFEQVEDAAADNAAAGVDAANRALRRLLPQLLEFVAGATSG